ncbi:MAG TPA: restriction endonuclease subunit S [Brevefilum fermentans]|jgi:type I restriction enzyme S subunit|nr:restriction endonuclease subunit S [Brevefilum fermentans]
MGKWQEYAIGDIADVVGGGTPKTKVKDYWGDEIPWLTPRDLSNFSGRFISKGERSITQKGLDNSSAKLLPKGTILLSSRAPVGYLAIAANEVSTNQGFRNLVPNANVDNIFLYYLLKQNIDYLKSQATGTTFEELSGSILKSLKFLIPPLPEQRAIADVLSALDDKIDLLHRQNQTLEALAQTLFRQWFIEEADDDWEEIILRDIADHIKINVNPQNFPEIIFHHYSIPAFDNGKTPVYELGKEIKSNKYHVPEKSILISKLNPRFPRVWMIQNEIKENSICSTEFQVIAPKDPQYYCFIYLFLKSQYTSNKLISAASGTSGSHQRVKPDDIFNLSSLIRNKTQIEKFNQEVSVMLEKIEENRRQINTLAMLRDILLPKLISGEVRVQ